MPDDDDDETGLREQITTLREELRQWEKCWNDPLLLLRRAYQLILKQHSHRVGAIAVSFVMSTRAIMDAFS